MQGRSFRQKKIEAQHYRAGGGGWDNFFFFILLFSNFLDFFHFLDIDL